APEPGTTEHRHSAVWGISTGFPRRRPAVGIAMAICRGRAGLRHWLRRPSRDAKGETRMEPLAMEKLTRAKGKGQGPASGSGRGKLFLATCLLPCALGLSGCVGTGSFLNLGGEAPNSVPCQVVATWNPGVVYTPDPAHDGAETPGLVGRIYIFGPEISCPLASDGTMVVDLYDDTTGPAAKDARPLEEWQ